jgi:hypothetical protein
MPTRFALLLTLLFALCAAAQPALGRATAQADSADVASVDNLVAALYDVVSGPAGEARDWARFRALFAPGARLHPIQYGDDSLRVPFTLTPDEFAERAALYFADSPFFEREIGRSVESYGGIVHVLSAYEVLRSADAEAPFARGVNSIQILYDGEAYRILSLTWDEETERSPIPEALGGSPPE